jgi:hypothetical protein
MYNLECSCDEEFWYVIYNSKDLYLLLHRFTYMKNRYKDIYFRVVEIVEIN